MTIYKTRFTLALTALAMTVVPGAYATNGYFAHGYGTANKALAGAGVALPQSAMQAATNPAGMVLVGTRFDIGIEAFNPMRDYQTVNNGTLFPPSGGSAQDSENEWFFIPHIGYNYMLDPNNSLGLTLYGNGGMNSRYSQNVFGIAADPDHPRTGVNLAQLFAAVTFAHKFNEAASVGVTPIFVYQRIAVEGIGGFGLFGVSTDSAHMSDRGADNSYGGGLRLGGQLAVGGGVTLGASWQSRMYMSRFHEYQGLFAEGGDFDVPPNYTVGVSWQALKNLAVIFDYQSILYSEVESVGNPLHTMTSSGRLGSENGAGFGWRDMDIYKLGIQYQLVDWTFRIGWSHGDQPIADGFALPAGIVESAVQFNIIAPAVIEDHFTFGFTKRFQSGNELSLAYMHAFKNSIRGLDLFGGGTAGNSTELTMSQNALEISFGMKW